MVPSRKVGESEIPQLAWQRIFEKSLEDGSLVRLNGLNSVLISDPADAPGKLLISDFQTSHFQHTTNVVDVVMCHHPPEWLAPGKSAGARPRQHQVVARAAVLVGHEIVGHPVLSQRNRLPLRQVVEGPVDESHPRVLHHHQLRAGDRGVIEREGHRVARGRVAVGCHRHFSTGAVGGGYHCGEGVRRAEGEGRKRGEDSGDSRVHNRSMEHIY